MLYNVPLTNEEIKAALELFDLAVRANGMGVATNAVILGTKLQAVIAAAPPPMGPPPQASGPYPAIEQPELPLEVK